MLLVTLLLVAVRLPRLRATLRSSGPVLAATALLVTGLSLCVWSYYVRAPDLLFPALSLTLLGSAGLLGGVREAPLRRSGRVD